MEKHAIDELSRTLASGASRRQLLRLLGGGVAVGAVTVTGLGAVEAKSKQRGKHGQRAGVGGNSNPFADIPVHGNVGQGQPFKGTLTITSFSTDNQQLFANGTLSGQYKTNQGWQTLNDNGVTAVPVSNIPVSGIPVAGAVTASGAKTRAKVHAAATCPILHLTLGPIDLNLLGLMIHLDQVVLNIDAQSGPGNLLGNLLCDVAGLLNGGGTLSQLLNGLVTLLNGVLAGL